MSTVFTAGNNMAYKHPKVLSFHGFKQFTNTYGPYLNDACTVNVQIEPAHWAAIRYKSNFILFYTKTGSIKIPYFSGQFAFRIINEYLPEEYRVSFTDDAPSLLDVESNTRHNFYDAGCGTITITNDRRVLYDEDE